MISIAGFPGRNVILAQVGDLDAGTRFVGSGAMMTLTETVMRSSGPGVRPRLPDRLGGHRWRDDRRCTGRSLRRSG